MAAAGVGLLAVLLVAVSVLFAQSDQTARAISTSRQAQRAQEVITATTAARSSVAVVLLLMSSDARLDSGEGALVVGVADLIEVLTELDNRVERLAATGWLMPPSALTSLAGQIDLTDQDGLRGLAEGEILPQVEAIELEAVDARDKALTLLAAEEGSAGSLARASSIAVGLLVPGMALVSYRAIQSRQQKQRELELRLRHEEERSRIKDEMIANLSHELRTPLTGIYGMALTLSDQGFEDRELSEELTDIIIGEAADLSRMVDDLLVAAKVDAGDVAIVPREVEPTAVVEEVSRPFVRSRDLEVSMVSGLVVADPLRLKQVVRNLVSNALKHGGNQIGVIGRIEDTNYRIMVVDDGSGVPDELRDRIFDRFVHEGVSPLTSGSVGLGLAIAKELTQRMGGRLTYERFDGFTAFNIELPLVPERRLAEPERLHLAAR